jgi:hypothetical protein
LGAYQFGRHTARCCWFEVIFKRCVHPWRCTLKKGKHREVLALFLCSM